METLHTYRKRINDDSVFVRIYSSEVEELTTEVQESLERQERFGGSKIGVFGNIEAVARKEARNELSSQSLSTSPKYLKPVAKFYSDLIKDELIRRLV